MTYCIRDREAGNVIEEVPELDEAVFILSTYEDTDREEGTYTPYFYEICKLEDGRWVPIPDEELEI